MSKASSHETWMKDVEARQRNIVFPDTANNEARFWRNIFQGRQKLRGFQKLGIVIFGFGVLCLMLVITFPHALSDHRYFFPDLLSEGIKWMVAFGILALFIGIFSVVQMFDRARKSRKREGQ